MKTFLFVTLLILHGTSIGVELPDHSRAAVLIMQIENCCTTDVSALFHGLRNKSIASKAVSSLIRKADEEGKAIIAQLLPIAQRNPTVCTMIVSAITHISAMNETQRPARDFQAGMLSIALRDLPCQYIIMAARSILTNAACSDTTKDNMLRLLPWRCDTTTCESAVAELLVSAVHANKGALHKAALRYLFHYGNYRDLGINIAKDYIDQSRDWEEKVSYY
jgi:hypothetical protein